MSSVLLMDKVSSVSAIDKIIINQEVFLIGKK